MREPVSNSGKRGSATSAPSFGGLARTIASWSTNLLATAVILVAGIVFGRQAMYWWNEPAADPSAGVRPLDGGLGDLGDLAAAHRFSAGGALPPMLREEFAGDREGAAARLRRRCRELGEAALDVARLPGPGERRMIAGLADQAPVEIVPDRWAIYQADGPALLVAMVAPPPAPAAAQTAPNSAAIPPEIGPSVVGEQARVVCWGLALPVAPAAGEGVVSWTLFTVATSGESSSPLPCPLPPGVAVTLSLASEGGASLVGFVGGGGAARVMEHFDHWAAEGGWRDPSGWRRVGASRHARFERAGHGALDVLLADEGEGLRGMVWLTPPRKPVPSPAD